MALVAACFALLVVAHPSAASAEGYYGSGDSYRCTPTLNPAAPVFAPLADTANYVVLPGGTFEGEMSGWSLNGASVVPGNEPWQVSGAADSQSLSISPGGSAISPPVCINSLFPTYRFFAHVPDGPTGKALHVSVRMTNSWGRTTEFPASYLSDANYGTWAATPALPLGGVIPAGVNVSVRFVFSAGSQGNSWSIDDVYLDPYAK
jgi:hypothetical protein